MHLASSLLGPLRRGVRWLGRASHSLGQGPPGGVRRRPTDARQRPGGGGARRPRGVRVPRRLVELLAGAAVLPLGAAVALTVVATSGPSATSPQGPPLASSSSLAHFHINSLNGPSSAGVLDPSPPALTTLPPAPALSQIDQSGTSVPSDTYTTAEIEAIITSAADADGVDPSWMIRTAQCESNLNPDSYNPSGPYYGLFQFLMSTFRAHGGTEIWDPVQQATITASMFASGNSSAWPVCSRR